MSDPTPDIIGGLTESPPRRWRRRGGGLVLTLVLATTAILAAAYFAAYVYFGDRVPKGTTVRGVEIGGLTASAAEDLLTARLVPQGRLPMAVSLNETNASLDPTTAGLSLDAAATVSAAGGRRSAEPSRMLALLFGGDDVAPVVHVDRAAMASALTDLSADLDKAPTDGAISLRSGTPKVTPARVGVALDRAGAIEALQKAYLTGRHVDLPFTESQPQITQEEVDRVMTEFVTPATSGPVVMTLGNHPITAKPKDYLKAISIQPSGSTLTPTLDPSRLLTALKPAMRTVADTPEDASFRIVDGRPRLIPAKVGVTFDKADLSTHFLDLIVKPAGERTLRIKATTAEPEFTTKEAKALGIRRRVSTFTTYFPYAAYRNINLPRAASLINGTVLKPGETFSLNDTVGERTAANGFTKGYVIKDGIFKEDFGGGVSQIATTTFNAMFFAGLEDVEHKPHSVYIDRYPVGREATVAWGALDLKFKNTTPYGILIEARVTKSSPSAQGIVTVSMYSTKYWDITTSVGPRTNYTQPKTRTLKGPDCEAATGLPGFTVDVWRYFRKAGSSTLVRTEKFHTVYRASDRVICK